MILSFNTKNLKFWKCSCWFFPLEFNLMNYLVVIKHFLRHNFNTTTTFLTKLNTSNCEWKHPLFELELNSKQQIPEIFNCSKSEVKTVLSWSKQSQDVHKHSPRKQWCFNPYRRNVSPFAYHYVFVVFTIPSLFVWRHNKRNSES